MKYTFSVILFLLSFQSFAQTTNPFRQNAHTLQEMLQFKNLLPANAQVLLNDIHETLWHQISNEIPSCKTSVKVYYANPHESVKSLKDFEESLIILDVTGCLKNTSPSVAAANYISERFYSQAIEGFIELRQNANQVCVSNNMSFVGLTSNCSFKQEFQSEEGHLFIRSSIISNHPKADSKLYLKETLVRFSGDGANNTVMRVKSFIRGEDIGFLLKSTVLNRIKESQSKSLMILEKISQD